MAPDGLLLYDAERHWRCQYHYPTGVVSTTVGTSNSGGFQVSRLPVRAAPYITIDQSGNTFPPTPIPSPFGAAVL